MKLLNTILVAVEVDDASGRVVAEAGTLARKFGSAVVLAHVIEPAGAYEPPEAAIATWLEKLRADLVSAGVSAPEPLRLRGKPFVEIIAAAQNLDANLIMLGARGMAAPFQFALGTTTEKVMRKSAKPVLAVVPNRPLRLATILCPVDCSDASGRGLTNAIRLARAFQAKLQVLTVIPPLPLYRRLDVRWSEGAAAAETAARNECVREFDDFLTRFDFQDVDWQMRIERGEPATEILDVANKWDADLIVMGSTGRTGLAHLLMGSTALKVARQFPCALLTVKKEEVLIAQLEQNITDIQVAYQEGQELLAQGFAPEALARFEQCLRIDPYFAYALEGQAAAHERLGHKEQAELCRKQAELIRRELWEKQAQASIRTSHPLFARHRSGE